MDVFTPTFYDPQPKFAIPRAYLKGIGIVWYALTTVVTPGNPIFIHSTFPPSFVNDTYITVRPEVWEWSTNAYTLDHIFQDEYSLRTDVPGKYRNSYSVRYAFGEDGKCAYINLYYTAATEVFRVNLPEKSRAYWIDLPPCPEILS